MTERVAVKVRSALVYPSLSIVLDVRATSFPLLQLMRSDFSRHEDSRLALAVVRLSVSTENRSEPADRSYKT